MKISIITLSAAAVAVSGAALGAVAMKPSPLGPPPARGTGLAAGQCFRSHDIRSHTLVGDDTILLNVGGRSTYRITVDKGCLGGAIPSDPIITHEPPGASIVCKPIDLDIGIARDGFQTKCIVDSIAKLSDQELAAVPAKLKP